jgi:hypothetical protein
MTTQKLPLFPLNTVLFPGAPLPLYIFEERYRLMIGRCIEQRAPFGVVLIRETDREDTDPNVTFHSVGTSAVISDGAKLEDGRYVLNTTGHRRFRVQYIAQRAPYFIGSITYLSEESGAAVTDSATQLHTLYERYWASVRAATGYQHEVEELPSDVIEMTYWMAHRLQVDNQHKQRWLEADVATRLREMIAALRAEIALLPGAGDSPTGPNLSDHSWDGPGSWN